MDLSYAEGWRPDEGDVLVGEVVEVSVGRSEFGAYPIVTVSVEGEDGADDTLVAIHGFHAALKNKLATLKPKVGERLGVKYLGKRQHKSNASREVADYIVKIDGRGAENVWSQFDTDVPSSDVPADASDFEPQGTTKADDDDIPF